jgi:hypothetical protein
MALAMTALIIIISYLFALVLLQIITTAYRKGKDIHFDNSIIMAKIAENPKEIANISDFEDGEDMVNELAEQASEIGALEEFRSYMSMHKYAVTAKILYYVSFGMIDMLPDYMIVPKIKRKRM